MNATDPGEIRVAILEEGELSEIFIERKSHHQMTGNIYKGRVVNIEPSLQAAFIDLGTERNGFLHVSDVLPPDGGYGDILRGTPSKTTAAPEQPPEQTAQQTAVAAPTQEVSASNSDQAPGGSGTKEEGTTGEPKRRRRRRGGRGRRGGRRARVQTGAVPLVAPGSDASSTSSAEAGPDGMAATPSPPTLSVSEPASGVERAADTGEWKCDAAEALPELTSQEAASQGVADEPVVPTEPLPEAPTGDAPVDAEASAEPAVAANENGSDRGVDFDEPTDENVDTRASNEMDDDDSDNVDDADGETVDHEENEADVEHDEDKSAGEETASAAGAPALSDEAGDADDAREADDEDHEKSDDQEADDAQAGRVELNNSDDDGEDDEVDGNIRDDENSDDDVDGNIQDDDNGDDDEDDGGNEKDGSSRSGGRRPARSSRGRSTGRRGSPRREKDRDTKRYNIQDLLKKGQEILVQVAKEGLGQKGPALTTYLSIPGRYVVVMPAISRLGVSKRIENEEQRRALKQHLQQINPPEGMGVIVRTAGKASGMEDLKRDVAYLTHRWDNIKKKTQAARAPQLLYEEGDVITRVFRDIMTDDVMEIYVDDEVVLDRAKAFMKEMSPGLENKIQLYKSKTPIFHKFNVEPQIQRLYNRMVPLKSGGSIVIEQTEALVAIDVNSGRFREKRTQDETILAINLEAAREVARQLRLRDIGGLIMIDLIDMDNLDHRRKVERELKAHLARDRARINVMAISSLGIVEMTRQRVRHSLRKQFFEKCPHCAGVGQVKSPETMGLEMMRELHHVMSGGRMGRLRIALNPSVAFAILNRFRKELVKVEEAHGISIEVIGDESVPPSQWRVYTARPDGNWVLRKASEVDDYVRNN